MLAARVRRVQKSDLSVEKCFLFFLTLFLRAKCAANPLSPCAKEPEYNRGEKRILAAVQCNGQQRRCMIFFGLLLPHAHLQQTIYAPHPRCNNSFAPRGKCPIWLRCTMMTERGRNPPFSPKLFPSLFSTVTLGLTPTCVIYHKTSIM